MENPLSINKPKLIGSGVKGWVAFPASKSTTLIEGSSLRRWANAAPADPENDARFQEWIGSLRR